MTSPAPPSDVSTAPATEEPPPRDGWPGGLAELRAELDRIDNAIHDLLMQRALIVEQVAQSGKPAAFRPGREASIMRRLMDRHGGSLPRQAIYRMWRELFAGTTSMQGGLHVAVSDPDTGAVMTQLAREHFGALTPLRAHRSSAQALAEIGNQTASVAVLPFPSETESWWTTLLHREPRIYVIASLPFWTVRPEGAPGAQALVVATSAPDASGHDRSLLGFELDADVSRARLAGELTALGLTPGTMVLRRDGAAAQVLVEVEGHLTDEDPRLAKLGGVLRRPVVLGGYAIPYQGGAV